MKFCATTINFDRTTKMALVPHSDQTTFDNLTIQTGDHRIITLLTGLPYNILSISTYILSIHIKKRQEAQFVNQDSMKSPFTF